MHLTKEDIQHVAWSRFDKENIKYFYLLSFGALAALAAFTLGFGRLFPENIWPVVGADVLILALIWVLVVRYNKLQQQAAKELIRQCELDPYLIYIGGQEVTTTKDEAVNPIR